MKKALFVLIAAAGVPFQALAVDGVVLINQSIVMAAGGFPYKITQPGSYKLSGNLTGVPVETDAIQVAADNVTIDLNGFAIIGPGFGVGGSLIRGTGIRAVATPSSFFAFHTTVINGSVRHMLQGIFLSEFAMVENVHSAANGDGIEVGLWSIVINNIAEGGGNNGIAVGANSVIRANVAANNRGGGFYVECPSSVIGNSASGNGGNFVLITTGGNCTTSENSAP